MTEVDSENDRPGWKKLVDDIRRQCIAFEILAESNPNLSPNILIQNIRKVLLNKEQSLEVTDGTDNSDLEKRKEIVKDGEFHDEHGLIVSNWAQVVESFDEMNLNPLLLQGIREFGYEHPSAIQKRVIVPCMFGWDVIAQAKPETGRTSAVVIGTLERIQRNSSRCQALIVTLTPESARHILGLVQGLGAYMGIACQPSASVLTGVADKNGQKLGHGVQIFIGIVQEVNSMLRRRAIRPDDVEILVIDDADKLLSGHLKEEMYQIMEPLAMGTQVVLMSTRLSNEVFVETKSFMRHPVSVWVKDEPKTEVEKTLKGVWEFYVDVETEEFKLPALENLYKEMSGRQALVFCNTTERVEWLSKMLRGKNQVVSALHGDLDKHEREAVLHKFASGGIRMLISTDFLTAGLERAMPHVPIVINYDFPSHAKTYIPRMGLGRRFGLGGITVSFVSDKDRRSFEEVQELFGSKISELPSDFTKYFP